VSTSQEEIKAALAKISQWQVHGGTNPERAQFLSKVSVLLSEQTVLFYATLDLHAQILTEALSDLVPSVHALLLASTINEDPTESDPA
jgi:hypothetical protein